MTLQPLRGHAKVDSTVPFPGLELEDALSIAAKINMKQALGERPSTVHFQTPVRPEVHRCIGDARLSNVAALRPNGRNLRISTFGEACALSGEQGSSAAPIQTLREAGRLMEGTRPGRHVLWALAPIGYCVRLFKNCCRIELGLA